MPRMNQYQHYLLQEFVDEYHQHEMSRRDLLRRALLIMGTAPAAAAALISLGCGTSGDDDDTPAATAEANGTAAASPTAAPVTNADPANTEGPGRTATVDIRTEDISFDGPGSELLGYLARPAGDSGGPHSGVLVIHENRGLNEHTKDIARRYAAEGFVALAVDLVSRAGGSNPDDTAVNTGALGSADIDDLIADMQAYATYLQALDGVRAGGIGVTGFCFGGGYTFDTAFNAPEVKAAVPYYGTCRMPNSLATTEVAFLVIYGGNDGRITVEADTVRAQLEQSGAPFAIEIYDGANHAFFNDTGSNYDAEAAADAWEKSLAWFREHLPTA